MANPNLYLGNKDFQPICQVGDLVGLMRPTDVLFGRVAFIQRLPLLIDKDLGAVTHGQSTNTTAILDSNGNDALRMGPDEFLQIRFALSPNDWPAVEDDATALLYVYQPGPASQLWTNLYEKAYWDLTTQNRFPDLSPTELFSWYDQTPQFQVVNNQASADLTASHVRFYGMRYLLTNPLTRMERRGQSGALADIYPVSSTTWMPNDNFWVRVPVSQQTDRRTTV